MIPLLPCRHRQAHFSLGLRLPSYKRCLVIVLLICAGYYLGGILGIRARLSPTGSSALWPPNAILLAALLLTPTREWWNDSLATLATHLHLTSNFQGNVALLVMLCQVVGNSFQVVIAALVNDALPSLFLVSIISSIILKVPQRSYSLQQGGSRRGLSRSCLSFYSHRLGRTFLGCVGDAVLLQRCRYAYNNSANLMGVHEQVCQGTAATRAAVR